MVSVELDATSVDFQGLNSNAVSQQVAIILRTSCPLNLLGQSGEQPTVEYLIYMTMFVLFALSVDHSQCRPFLFFLIRKNLQTNSYLHWYDIANKIIAPISPTMTLSGLLVGSTARVSSCIIGDVNVYFASTGDSWN